MYCTAEELEQMEADIIKADKYSIRIADRILKYKIKDLNKYTKEDIDHLYYLINLFGNECYLIQKKFKIKRKTELRKWLFDFIPYTIKNNISYFYLVSSLALSLSYNSKTNKYNVYSVYKYLKYINNENLIHFYISELSKWPTSNLYNDNWINKKSKKIIEYEFIKYINKNSIFNIYELDPVQQLINAQLEEIFTYILKTKYI